MLSDIYLGKPIVIWIFLVGNLLLLPIVYFITRTIGKKKRLFDERHKEIMNQAKAKSWNITFFVLFFAYIVMMLFDYYYLHLIVMSIVFQLHCGSFMVASVYFRSKVE
ncbi:hypothetical protein CAI16_08900 [Virgibacillus dokdonensis]|uniref:DUF3796 domain-containing protein n=1 Tax=Virgibacillus dokdonensis TaxID=302167 RepID=A0A3E0WQW1_9BACI|nr:hypothetical protein [Virgibacillus dokdonensis]RFA35218.1 hypothetical protein CAI16_08900 [Virgibacillus dokdonensis]